MTTDLINCPECDLPVVECNALTHARWKLEEELRKDGYEALKAMDRARELIPYRRRTAGL